MISQSQFKQVFFSYMGIDLFYTLYTSTRGTLVFLVHFTRPERRLHSFLKETGRFSEVSDNYFYFANEINLVFHSECEPLELARPIGIVSHKYMKLFRFHFPYLICVSAFKVSIEGDQVLYKLMFCFKQRRISLVSAVKLRLVNYFFQGVFILQTLHHANLVTHSRQIMLSLFVKQDV